MDIICPICGEPWDAYELHDAPGGYQEASFMFRRYGCGVAFNGKPCEAVNNEETEKAKVIYSLLGDDLDGASSIMEGF